MNKSTKWYQENKHLPGVREEYNARQRAWYYANLERARENGRRNAEKYRNRNHEKCSAATEVSRIKRWKRNRAFIDSYKTFFGCRRCHGQFDPVALDLHHVNEEEKEFTVSAWMHRASILALVKELEKCEVLCANCHRIEHVKN